MSRRDYFHNWRLIWFAAALLTAAGISVTARAGMILPPEGTARAPDLARPLARVIQLAAEVPAIAPAGPDQAAKAAATAKIPDAAAAARVELCKSQWSAADADGDGILAGDEITHYNATIRSQNQPKLSEDARLAEGDFMKACTAVASHE